MIMNMRRAAALTAITLVPACSIGQAVQMGDSGALPSSRWQAAMSSPPSLDGAVEMAGMAWMANGEQANTTRIEIEIENAAPGGEHPWEVRQGRCGSDRGLFGSSGDYEPLEVGGDGRATASATVQQVLPSSGDYSVSVFAAPTNRDLVVACGNLAPPIA